MNSKIPCLTDSATLSILMATNIGDNLKTIKRLVREEWFLPIPAVYTKEAGRTIICRDLAGCLGAWEIFIGGIGKTEPRKASAVKYFSIPRFLSRGIISLIIFIPAECRATSWTAGA